MASSASAAVSPASHSTTMTVVLEGGAARREGDHAELVGGGPAAVAGAFGCQVVGRVLERHSVRVVVARLPLLGSLDRREDRWLVPGEEGEHQPGDGGEGESGSQSPGGGPAHRARRGIQQQSGGALCLPAGQPRSPPRRRPRPRRPRPPRRWRAKGWRTPSRARIVGGAHPEPRAEEPGRRSSGPTTGSGRRGPGRPAGGWEPPAGPEPLSLQHSSTICLGRYRLRMGTNQAPMAHPSGKRVEADAERQEVAVGAAQPDDEQDPGHHVGRPEPRCRGAGRGRRRPGPVRSRRRRDWRPDGRPCATARCGRRRPGLRGRSRRRTSTAGPEPGCGWGGRCRAGWRGAPAARAGAGGLWRRFGSGRGCPGAGAWARHGRSALLVDDGVRRQFLHRARRQGGVAVRAARQVAGDHLPALRARPELAHA